MSSPFPTLHVVRASTVDRTAEELRRAIFDGELAGGVALREIALADSLGVSRSTVREALALLVAEGLAVRAPHRGVTVAAAQASSVRDTCRARFVLEGAGVLAWPTADEHLHAAVRDRLTAYTDAVEREGSYEELNRRHLAFHVSLVGLTASPRLVTMAQGLVAELRLALAQVERIRRNAHDEADSHTALLHLLEAGRIEGPDGAHEFLRAHLAHAAADIIDALGLSG